MNEEDHWDEFFEYPWEVVDCRELRTRLGLSQTQFAQRFGIPVATLRQWEQHPAIATRAVIRARRPPVNTLRPDPPPPPPGSYLPPWQRDSGGDDAGTDSR